MNLLDKTLQGFRSVAALLPLRRAALEAAQLGRCTGFDEYQRFLASTETEQSGQRAHEAALQGTDEAFDVPGYCSVCGRGRRFRVGYSHCFALADGRRVPNWREHLVCLGCGLNNRMRAAYSFLLAAARVDDAVYLTERTTPLFRAVSGVRRNTLGSEFLRDGTRHGELNSVGVRHEDVTRLTLPDMSVDHIGTFDVLEHVPDYRLALANLFRCLRPGGTLLVTVPFALHSRENVVRAVQAPDGSVRHLLPPEYHGDPLDSSGVLCFYHFGWEFLDDLRRVGFEAAQLRFYWSRELGHLGEMQFVITARKPSAERTPARDRA
jgi:SAM-dependent methyltransferase